MVISFVANTLYMNVASLLPAYVEDRWGGPHSFAVGCLMAVFPVGFLITAPIVGQHMGRLGRKNVVLTGVFIFTLATLGFGLAAYAQSKWTFYFVSMFARVLQGVADALINVALPSLVCQEFPEKKDVMVGYVLMALGLGLTIGPVLGSLFYGWVGYIGAFYIFAALIGVIGTLCTLLLPARMNKPDTPNQDESQNQENSTKVTYMSIMSNRESFSTVLICIFAFCCTCFVDPILAVRLISLGMTQNNVGFAFAAIGIAVIISSPIAGYLAEKFNTIYVFQVSIIGLSCMNLLCGPVQALPQTVWLIIIGIFGTACFSTFLYVPVTP